MARQPGYDDLEQWLYDTGLAMPGDVKRIAHTVRAADWFFPTPEYTVGDKDGAAFAWFTSQKDALNFKQKCERDEPDGEFFIRRA